MKELRIQSANGTVIENNLFEAMSSRAILSDSEGDYSQLDGNAALDISVDQADPDKPAKDSCVKG